MVIHKTTTCCPSNCNRTQESWPPASLLQHTRHSLPFPELRWNPGILAPCTLYQTPLLPQSWDKTQVPPLQHTRPSFPSHSWNGPQALPPACYHQAPLSF